MEVALIKSQNTENKSRFDVSRKNILVLLCGHFEICKLGQNRVGVFLLYDLGDEKAPVCEILCFYHILNTRVDFWTLAPVLQGVCKPQLQMRQFIVDCMHDYPVYEINPGNFVFYK